MSHLNTLGLYARRGPRRTSCRPVERLLTHFPKFPVLIRWCLLGERPQSWYNMTDLLSQCMQLPTSAFWPPRQRPWIFGHESLNVLPYAFSAPPQVSALHSVILFQKYPQPSYASCTFTMSIPRVCGTGSTAILTIVDSACRLPHALATH